MISKYKVIQMTTPEEILPITVSLLEEIIKFIDATSPALKLLKAAITRVERLGAKMRSYDFALLKRELLCFF